MARVRTAKHPKPVEPEDESQEQPEEPETGQETHGKATSKAEAVRMAVAQGVEAPGDIVDFARKRFGVELTKQMASSYKAQAKARESKKLGAPTVTQRSRGGSGGSIVENGLIADIAAVKALVKRLGAEQVKQIVDLFE